MNRGWPARLNPELKMVGFYELLISALTLYTRELP